MCSSSFLIRAEKQWPAEAIGSSSRKNALGAESGIMTARLPDDDPPADLFENETGQLRALDLRGIKRQGNGDGELA
jgi:hypothetical protein